MTKFFEIFLKKTLVVNYGRDLQILKMCFIKPFPKKIVKCVSKVFFAKHIDKGGDANISKVYSVCIYT